MTYLEHSKRVQIVECDYATSPCNVARICLCVITSRVCGRGNVFVVSVCLSVWAITFEQIDIETSFLVWCYILTISRSNFSIKVIGSRSRSSHGKW